MENLSAFSEVFLQEARRIFDRQSGLLVLIRYHASAGNRDYFHFDSLIAFQRFLTQRKSKEALTLFNSKELVKQGKASNLVNCLQQPKYSDWLIIFPEDNSGHWNYCENQLELNQELTDHFNQQTVILEDPLYQKPEEMVLAYVPDCDGMIRPGIY